MIVVLSCVLRRQLLAMFTAYHPLVETCPADKSTAAQPDGGKRFHTVNCAVDEVVDMRLGTTQPRRNLGYRQEGQLIVMREL